MNLVVNSIELPSRPKTKTKLKGTVQHLRWHILCSSLQHLWKQLPKIVNWDSPYHKPGIKSAL